MNAKTKEPQAIEEQTSRETPFAKWYKNNRSTLRETRKKRYAEDPALRAKIAEQNRRHRANNPKAAAGDTATYRELNGQQVQVFRISAAAEAAGRDEQSIRIWEEKGYIPKPLWPDDAHRLYTQNQLDLIASFSQTMTDVRYKPKERADTIAKQSQIIAGQWAS